MRQVRTAVIPKWTVDANLIVRFAKQYIIDATSEESIDLSFATIGDDLGISNADRSKVLTRLSRLKEEWLLIYDNADDPEISVYQRLNKASQLTTVPSPALQ